MQLWELSATDAVRAMRSGEVSPVELVQALLDRIRATDGRLLAWETVDAEGALTAARRLEARRRERRSSDLLFGLPLGVKDVIHARGLPTSANFEPYRGKPVHEDSGVVQYLREAGAIVLGKTVTVQFAWGMEPPGTRNPWDETRTPGGSSSGSAASVAARQVPAALGTQTGGSNLRPAAYCGLVGLKPTFGRLSRYGIFPVSWTLDHAGIIVRTAADAALVLQAGARYDARDPFSARQAPEDFVGATREPGAAPRLGLLRDLVERSDPPVRQATEEAVERLARAGAEIKELRLPTDLDVHLSTFFLISFSEGSAIHAEQYTHLAEHYTPGLRANTAVGQLLPAAAYVQALRLRRRLRAEMDDLLAGVDAIISPTVVNLPPDPSTTGNYSFQTLWTLYGHPSMTVPTALGPDRLPRALQIAGRMFEDRTVLRVGAWCEAVFGTLPSPL